MIRSRFEKTPSISTPAIPQDFASGLDDYVRAKYDELWETAQLPEGEY